MPKDVIDLPVLGRQAQVRAESIDPKERTAEIVWTTGAVVRRWTWEDGEIDEELAVTPEAVRMGRLNEGAPLLDSHAAYRLAAVLGVVVEGSARLDGGRGVATVRFSERAEVEPVWRDVQAGILRNVSVGYRVHRYEVTKRDGQRPLYRAVDWEPMEASLVAIGADPGAQVRSEEPARHSCVVYRADAHAAKEAAMPIHETAASNAAEAARQAEAGEKIANEIRTAERARIASLAPAMASALRAGLGQTAADCLRERAVAEGWDAQRLQAEMFEALAAREAVNEEAGRQPPSGFGPRPVAQVGRSSEDPAAVLDAMATALAVRGMPDLQRSAGDGRWREYAGLRPTDLLLDLAQSRGERVGPRDRHRLIERAFHTTSDFPLLLANAGNKMLEAGYAQAEPTFRRFFGRRRFNDFRAHSFLTSGDFPALEVLSEGGEITSGTISEKREQITAKTHARSFSVTRQMLVNDDLGAFTDFAAMIGRRIADYENAVAFALVNTASGDGPTLTEGNAAVFTTGRTNKAGTAAAVTTASVQLGMNAMMAMTSLDGLKLNIQPRYLVCSPIQRFAALQLASAAVVPSAPTNVNVLAGAYEVVADANIPNNRWYLFADPMAAPVYVYGYVGDAEGPMIRQGQPMGRDGIQIDVIHDFAVGAIDFRGGYYNSGTAPA